MSNTGYKSDFFFFFGNHSTFVQTNLLHNFLINKNQKVKVLSHIDMVAEFNHLLPSQFW